MSNKKLSFKLGQEKNRGELYTRHSNITENTVVSFEEGQTLFSYSEIDSTKYPYKPYDHTYKTKSSKDARIYIDLSNERIPISSYFSDYSSKLWDLSSGTEFNCGNNGHPIFFSNGVPCPAQFKIETVDRATLGTTPNTFKVSIDATNDNQAIVKLPCNFGICSTAGNTIAKTVTVDISSDTPFILGNGIKVTILFQNGNTQGLSNVTLNVNNTGAKKIKIGNSSNLSTNFIKSGQICHFTYYNNYWYLDSSPEATASQNGLLSTNSQQIKGQKDFLDKILLRNGFEFRGPSAVPLASLSGSNIGDSKNGLVTLTLGSIASAVDQGKGCIKLYNNEIKTTTLTTYSADTNTSNQNIYFRNYGSADNYFVTTNTPLKVGGSDDTNGDKPVYISDKGVATVCNGIVVTQEEQTFSGEKTFNGPINIDIQYGGTSGLIENSDNVYKYLAIKNGNDDYIAIDNKCIQKCGQDTELLINPDGGRVSFSEGTFCIDDNGIVTINTETVSTSSDTGALVVTGGIGVSGTSYMSTLNTNTIYPKINRTYDLGSNKYIWANIHNNNLYFYGSSGTKYIKLAAESAITSATSSTNITIPKITGNLTISDTETHEYESESGGAYYNIPFYKILYKQLSSSDAFRILSKKGTASREGQISLNIGNGTASGEAGNCTGEIRLYGSGKNYAALSYVAHNSSQKIQFRRYNNITNSTVYPIVTSNTDAVGGNATTGDTPVYISSSGVATACNGIVVTEGNQTFTGSKTFNTQLIINNVDDISLSTISEAAFIIKNSQYTMGFDSNEILVSKADGTSSVLYLNDGGEVQIDGTFHLQQAGNYGSTLPDSNLRAGRVFFKIIS